MLRTKNAAIVETTSTTKLAQLTAGRIPQNVHSPQGRRSGRISMPRQRPHSAKDAVARPHLRVSAQPDAAVPAPDGADFAFIETWRKRDKDHRASVASKECLVCRR